MKKLICMMLALSLAATLVACSQPSSSQEGDTQNSTATQEATEEPAEVVEMSFWVPSSSVDVDGYFTDVVAAFNEANPDLNYTLEFLPGTAADINTSLNSAKLAGNYPDVVSVYAAILTSRSAQGEFMDLQPYIDGWEDSGDIYESVLNMGVVDNTMYGMAFQLVPEMLVYRTDYFEEAGLDPAAPPSNWEELREAAEALTVVDEAGNVTRAGFDVPAINTTVFMRPFVWQNNGSYVDYDAGVPTMNTPEAVEAFEFVGGFVHDNLTIPYDYNKKEETPFVKGTAAMSMLQPAQIASMISADPALADVLAIASPLTEDAQSAFCGPRLLTINQEAENPDGAWRFIEYIMSPEEVTTRFTEHNMPNVRTSLDEAYIAEDPVINEGVISYVRSGQSMETVEWAGTMNRFLETAFQDYCNEAMGAEEALQLQEDELNKNI